MSSRTLVSAPSALVSPTRVCIGHDSLYPASANLWKIFVPENNYPTRQFYRFDPLVSTLHILGCYDTRFINWVQTLRRHAMRCDWFLLACLLQSYARFGKEFGRVLKQVKFLKMSNHVYLILALWKKMVYQTERDLSYYSSLFKSVSCSTGRGHLIRGFDFFKPCWGRNLQFQRL